MKKILIVLFAFLFCPLQAMFSYSLWPVIQAQEEPDSIYEAQIFDIYINYHSQPTSLQEWSTLIGDKDGEFYEVRRGDNLWNISRTLFGDGHFWPKVWSQNQSIKNPHLIEVGQRIVFLPGDESNAPAYALLGEKKAEALEEVQGVEATEEGSEELAQDEEASGEEALEPDVEIPSPTVPLVPVLRKIPPSLPEWQARGTTDFGRFGIDIIPFPQVEALHSVDVGYYVSETLPQRIGTIIGVEGGAEGDLGVAGKGQYVYLQVREGQASVGTSLTVVKSLGKLEKVNRLIKGSVDAYNIEVQGRVKIVEKLGSKKVGGGHVDQFKAFVQQSITTLMVGSDLIEKSIRKVELNSDGPRSEVVAEVIGGAFDNNRVILGTGSIIFLNKGSNDGLRKNHVLSVRETISVRNERALFKGNNRSIARIQVIDVQPNFATATVLNSWEIVTPGDVTGRGELLTAQSGSGDEESFDDDDMDGDDMDNEEDEFDMDDDEYDMDDDF